MKFILRLTFLFFAFFQLSFSAYAQDAPFNKGVNLSNWFQAENAQDVSFSRYTKQDFENIKSLGCDVVRLPINLHFMTDGAPDYTLDPLFLTLTNEVIDWAEELSMHLILDNHTFSTGPDTSPQSGEVLKKVWKQMGQEFESRSEYIHYEMLNEPHGIEADLWHTIVGEVIDEIRSVDTKHSIIIGGVNWNSLDAMINMPAYEDDNLIYTFHYYNPFIFTHQGATWTGPSMADFVDIPFPYDENTMPAMPATFEGTWLENAYNNYSSYGNENAVTANLDAITAFKQERNVPVYCGEFGVYQPNSMEADRVYWYEVVRSHLEALGTAWTMWDYHGGFGIFNEGGQGLFDHDFNVPLGEALGFTSPAQTPFVSMPDSVGMIIYDDFVGPNILLENWSSGDLNIFSTEAPNYGDYCIRWEGADLYQGIGFDFAPIRDFSQLREENYFMDFFARTNGPWENAQFDLRFVDTKTDDPEDHPWRMRMVVSAELGDDGVWKRIRLPLKDFSEHGSWDNNQWYPPEGKFDWTAIDEIAIVTEYTAFDSTTIWIDHIAITNVDTVTINDDTPFVINAVLDNNLAGIIEVSPNPMQDWLLLKATRSEPMGVEVMTAQGVQVDQFELRGNLLKDFSGLAAGIYFLRFFEDGVFVGTVRVVKGG